MVNNLSNIRIAAISGLAVLASNALCIPANFQGREWVTFQPYQCEKSPWQEQNSEQSEEESIRNYFTCHNISVYDVRLNQNEGRVTCAACGCPTSYTFSVLIDKDNAGQVEELLP